MAKVFGIHEVELRPGVTAEEFERFLTQEYIPGAAPLPAGWQVSYLKGNRGERVGKFAILFEIASVEDRDRLFTVGGEGSTEFQQWLQQQTAAQEALADKLSTFVTPPGETYTDYEVIAG